MQEWLISLITNHQYLVYGVIILVSFFEGPILAVLCGFLIHLDLLPLVPIYITLMIGDLIGDVVWYSIGRMFGHSFTRKFGKYFSITEEGVTRVTKIFQKHTSRILIISKITMGFGFAIVTLFTAGMSKIPFNQYISLNIAGQVIWTGILLFLGYFFGNLYEQLDGIFAKISVVALIVLISIGLIGYGKYIKGRMVK